VFFLKVDNVGAERKSCERLYRIKTLPVRFDFLSLVKLKCQSGTVILSVGIRYYTRDPIRDVNYCMLSSTLQYES